MNGNYALLRHIHKENQTHTQVPYARTFCGFMTGKGDFTDIAMTKLAAFRLSVP